MDKVHWQKTKSTLKSRNTYSPSMKLNSCSHHRHSQYSNNILPSTLMLRQERKCRWTYERQCLPPRRLTPTVSTRVDVRHEWQWSRWEVNLHSQCGYRCRTLSSRVVVHSRTTSHCMGIVWNERPDHMPRPMAYQLNRVLVLVIMIMLKRKRKRRRKRHWYVWWIW